MKARPDRARNARNAGRTYLILSDAWEWLQGEPLDSEHPQGDLWLAAAFAMFPAFAILEVLL